MNIDEKLKKYGIVVVGLLLGGGFAFGGIASYSGMVSSGPSGNNNQQEFNTTLPDNTFKDGSYLLSVREQRVLASNFNSVFVTLLYEDQDERQRYLSYQGAEQGFQGRMYIQVLNKSQHPQYDGLGRDKDPKAVFIGGARGRSGIEVLEQVEEEDIRDSGCSVLSTWNPSDGPSLTSYCSQ